jgi:two-component system, OmpR family, response regulator BaeR
VTPHILVAEDDAKIAQLVLDYLRNAGFEARSVADGLLALNLIKEAAPEVLILDGMLPGCDGLSVCRAVRAFSDVPILMLTARVDEADRLQGLEAGADDYVCKPFSPREVVARVRALLRRSDRAGSAHSRSHSSAPSTGWTFDEAGLRMAWRGQWLPLTPLEFRMLRLLLSHPGRVFSRAQLLDTVHADWRDVSDRAIDSHIKNLRRKLEATQNHRDAIVSVYGVGYRLDAVGDCLEAEI